MRKSDFDSGLIGYLEKVQNESNTALSTRIKLNISKEQLDWIVYMLKYGTVVESIKELPTGIEKK